MGRGIAGRNSVAAESTDVAATRHLAAILAADVAGYSRLMGADEEGTLDRLKTHRRQLVDLKIREHRGRIVKTTGDGMLVEFPSVVDAVRCAVEIQRAMVDRNAAIPDDKRIAFRIGVNLGDVIADGNDVYGDGVNIAARLEALAEPGGLCISRTVRDHIGDRLPYAFDDIGEQSVKNIAQPVHVYAMNAAAVAALPKVAMAAQPGAPRGRNGVRLAAVAAVVAAVAGIGIAAWWVLPKATPTTASIQAPSPVGAQSAPVAEAKPALRLSIVVLPFQNLSNDPDQEYFADGITDDLTTDLSRISGSFVIARNTAFTYKGKPIDAKQIGRDLGVRYVLEGSVRRSGDQVRVNAQLIDAENGAHLWADRFDTDRANISAAQNEITNRLARSLDVELVRDASRRIEQEKAVDPDARDLVMRGWALYYQPPSAANRQEALSSFERALQLDPDSVDARIGVARVLVGRFGDGFSNSFAQDGARAEQLLFEALDTDSTRPMAYAILGLLHRLQGRVPEARIDEETAIALDPSFSWAHWQLGWTLLYLGEIDLAISEAQKAMQLSPRDPSMPGIQALLGWCYLFSNRVDPAIEWLVKSRAAMPRVWWIHYTLAGALGLKGDVEGAKSSLADLRKVKPEVDSIANFYRYLPFATYPTYRAQIEKTINEGLRRVGFPET